MFLLHKSQKQAVAEELDKSFDGFEKKIEEL